MNFNLFEVAGTAAVPARFVPTVVLKFHGWQQEAAVLVKIIRYVDIAAERRNGEYHDLSLRST